MKILIVNTNDINGGAARAAYRLHQSLINTDISSEMLVITKQSDDRTVLSLSQSVGKIRQRLRRLQFFFLDKMKNYPNRTKTLFSPSYLKYSEIVDKINEINPDIVHLHWICNEMIRVEELGRIKAPIVWSLHDMWSFTGGCHYDEECGRYVDSCGQCKVLKSIENNDLSRDVFIRKHKTYSQIDNLTIVGLSHWLSDCAKESSLFNNRKVVTIPNPIDTNIFKPIDKRRAREIFSLPKDKKLILFGAMSSTGDPRKGFLLLQEAINKLKLENVEIVVFGSGEPKNPPSLKFKVRYLGQFQDDSSLQVLYSACDVMVVPSIQENLSNTIMESLACATPVVGFFIGGNADLISHRENGYLARALEVTDLAKGICWVLTDANYDELCRNARESVMSKFESSKVVNQYVTLYEEALARRVVN